MALTDVKSEQIQSSVALAGSPTTTTQSASDNSTKIATTAYVETAVANLVASAPSALNTLDELAAALNDDASFSTTVTNSIATKLPLAGGTLTGALTINHADGLLVHDTNGTASNRLKFLYNGTSGVATLGPHSTGGNTSLVIGTSNSGTFTTALTINSSQAATFAGTISSGAITSSASLKATDYRVNEGNSLAGGLFKEKNLTGSGSSNDLSIFAEGISNGGNIHFMTGGSATIRATIDSSGNVGIGNSSPAHELDILGGNLSTLRHNSLRIMSNTEGTGSETNIMHNVKYNSGFKYVVADEAARIQFINGITTISRAVAGSAGASATWLDTAIFDASGNVGIGTSNVDSKLHVSYTSSNSNPLVEANAGLNLEGSSSVRMLFGTDQASPYAGYIQASNTGSGFPLSLNPSGGNVGIGTTSPDALLEVSNITDNDLPFVISGGTASLSSLPDTTGMAFGYGSAAGYKKGAIIWEFTSTAGIGKLHLANDGVADAGNAQLSDSKMTIDSSGRVGIGNTNPAQSLHVGSSSAGTSSNGIRIEQNEGAFDLRVDAGEFYLYDVTDARIPFLIDTSGNVGIGTSAPYTKLQVEGTVSDTYTPTAFLDKQQVRIRHPNAANNYGGIGFSNSVGNYEWFVGVNQTSASPAIADFVIQGADSTSTYTENMRIDCGGHVTMPRQTYVQGRGQAGWSAFASGWNIQPHAASPTCSVNRGGAFNNTNKRFTAPVEGVYLVCASWYIYHPTSSSRGNQYVHPAIYVNGSINWNSSTQPYTIYGHNESDSSTTHFDGIQLTHTVYLAANDYIDLRVYSVSTSTQSYENYFYFSYTLLN
jgi:hypothetical protein